MFDGLGTTIVDALVAALDGIFGRVLKWLAEFIEFFAGFFVSFGGQLIDLSIEFSLHSAMLAAPGIVAGWEIFRDLVNMTFIFILLYIAFMTILQASSFDTRRILAKLVIVALLINFSFFLTGFVIDVGNATGNIVYNAITDNVNGIGGTLIGALNTTELFDQLESQDVRQYQLAILHMFNAVFLFVTAFVFISGAFLFFFRQVTLIFLLILSPLAFAAYILPNTQNQFKKWINLLIGQTFVAPIYLLLVAVVIIFAQTSNAYIDGLGLGGFGETNEALAAPGFEFLGAAGTYVINYIILIGMMIASLNVAKNLSGKLGSTSSAWAGKVMGIGLGGAGYAYRNTVGRGARALANNSTFQEKARNASGLSGAAMRATLRTSDSISKTTGDLRNVAGVGAGFGALGTSVGSGSKDGFLEQEKKRKERLLERDKRTGQLLGHDKKAVDKIDEQIGEYDELTGKRTGLTEEEYKAKRKLRAQTLLIQRAQKQGKKSKDEIKDMRDEARDTRNYLTETRQKIQDKKDEIEQIKRRPALEHAERIKKRSETAKRSWLMLRTRKEDKDTAKELKKSLKSGKKDG